MSKSNNDLIAQALNINPLVVHDHAVPMVIDARDNPATKVTEDFENARANLYTLIASGGNALKEAIDLAAASQNPKAFDAVSNLINTLVNANKDLLTLQQMARDIEEQPGPEAPNTVNNNLFVGTTEEALKMLKQRRKEQNGNEGTT